ncbi:hypothetical protein [Paenibacillus terrigena]|uniref:hypothetical protein n=1 Tax=Paenibacillus terrigena TaxID=369333 RepID=UPI00037D57BB|nr:hypothetical protein [Paenibacillus terrigena]
MELKKVLIICYDYLPIGSPHAYRWSAIAEKWVENGHQVDIVSVRKPGLLQQEKMKGVNVHRVAGGLLERVRKRVTSKVHAAQDQKENQTTLKSSAKKMIVKTLKMLHDMTWKKIYWPDYACLWFYPAYRRAKSLQVKHGYDFVVSVSHPFTSHVVANRLKTKNPELTWLVDVGDPFCILEETPTNNVLLYQRLNYKYERLIFQNANAVGITPEAIASYITIFPESENKMHVIPPMLTIQKAPESLDVFKEDGKIRFVFIGTLYRKIRNPDFLLQLFRRMLDTPYGDRLELHFFGNVHDCEASFTSYEDLLHTHIFMHGVVEHHVALNAMQQADVLVNISNRTPLQLPSKVVEYASTGNRILNIADIDHDNSEIFFNRYPSAITIRSNLAILDEEVVSLLEKLFGMSNLKGETLSDWMRPYQLNTISDQFMGILSHS